MAEDGNDYVGCAECGHPLERHTPAGCDYASDGCPCTASWTVREIREARRAAGLPVAFRPYDH